MARHVSPIHRPRILAIADAIEHRSEAESAFKGMLGFYMGDFIHEVTPLEHHPDNKMPACGTTACIAGWSYALRTKDIQPIYVEHFLWEDEAEWLGLTEDEGRGLFYSTHLTDEQAVQALRLIADGEEIEGAIYEVSSTYQEAENDEE